MVWTGPVGLRYGPGVDSSWRPPLTYLDPNLTGDDVAWLNRQMELIDKPTVRFAREIALPPPPSGRRPSAELRLPSERIR